MPEISTPLVIGVSTRALFDLREEHGIFEREGVQAYAQLQLEREAVVLQKGTAFEVVRRVLALNTDGSSPIVEVVLLSRNSPDLSLRAFNSIEHYGLAINHGSFTSGRSVAPLVRAWSVDIFLSNEVSDVQAAARGGTAAARLHAPPRNIVGVDEDEVRFAFDGDAVLFSEESDLIYKTEGLQKFLEHEKKNASVPMTRGPFGNFLKKLAILREANMRPNGSSKVRIALVTARNAPAHSRVIQTFRAWGTPADEAHFVGRHDKRPMLEAMAPHIFFDDQEKHVLSAAPLIASGHVPGPHLPTEPVIPAA